MVEGAQVLVDTPKPFSPLSYLLVVVLWVKDVGLWQQLEPVSWLRRRTPTILSLLLEKLNSLGCTAAASAAWRILLANSPPSICCIPPGLIGGEPWGLVCPISLPSVAMDLQFLAPLWDHLVLPKLKAPWMPPKAPLP